MEVLQLKHFLHFSLVDFLDTYTILFKYELILNFTVVKSLLKNENVILEYSKTGTLFFYSTFLLAINYFRNVELFQETLQM